MFLVPLSREAQSDYSSSYDFGIHIREALDVFSQILLTNPIYMKQTKMMDEESKMILRQLGFGAVLGIAFLSFVYLGGLIAHLVSGL